EAEHLVAVVVAVRTRGRADRLGAQLEGRAALSASVERLQAQLRVRLGDGVAVGEARAVLDVKPHGYCCCCAAAATAKDAGLSAPGDAAPRTRRTTSAAPSAAQRDPPRPAPARAPRPSR